MEHFQVKCWSNAYQGVKEDEAKCLRETKNFTMSSVKTKKQINLLAFAKYCLHDLNPRYTGFVTLQ